MSEQPPMFYPEDAIAVDSSIDAINLSDARTLDELFRERVRRSPEKIAYSQYDTKEQQWLSFTWAQMAQQVERWQVAFREVGLVKGDRVAICHKNSVEWVIFDQAALRLGLVVVPLYTADRADNIGYVLGNSKAKLALFSNEQVWSAVNECDEDISSVETVLVLDNTPAEIITNTLVRRVEDWLPEYGQHLERGLSEASDLASIVYTSGTTGRPKGVMLSHKNILSNAYNGMRSVALKPTDHLLSFLPLSHTLERTIGYYAPMLCGSCVTFNRSISELSDDLLLVKPTVMVSVPRIFERVHNQIYSSLNDMSSLKRILFKRAIKTGWHRFEWQQGRRRWHPRLLLAGLLDRLVGQPVRDKLGGNLDFVIVGGAPLSIDVAKTFISLGIPLLQGYGLTETSPVVSVNTLSQNQPDSIGLLLRGVAAKIMGGDELWVKGDAVMQGYWQNPEATAKTMEGEWLKTGDCASIDEQGFIRIIGRIKDILVLANGEKVPPSDIEAAIVRDALFEQVMVIGEGKSYLCALVVVNEQRWQESFHNQGVTLDSEVSLNLLLKKVAAQMSDFPGYARVRKIHATFDEWTVEAGLLTPTLKVKRPKVLAVYEKEVKKLYAGHGVYSL